MIKPGGIAGLLWRKPCVQVSGKAVGLPYQPTGVRFFGKKPLERYRVHTVQTVCYVPTHRTTRNYTTTPCTAGYYTKYTLYHVGLLSYIRYHEVVPRYHVGLLRYIRYHDV